MNYLFGTGKNKETSSSTYSIMGLPLDSGVNGEVAVFTAIDAFEPSFAKATGYLSSIAMDTSGNIWVVGSNGPGWLGVGGSSVATWTKVPPIKPGVVAVPNLSGKTIALAYNAYFVIGSDGNLYACGINMAAQGSSNANNLGLGSTNNTNEAFIAAFTSEAVQEVVCSWTSTMIMTVSKKIYVTGLNNNGQMNKAVSALNGYQTFTEITKSVLDSLQGNSIKGIAASSSGTFYVIDNYDYVYSWGSNAYRLLGRNPTTSATRAPEFDWQIKPVVYNSNGATKPFPSFKVGDSVAIAIGADGYAYIWGIYNSVNYYELPTLMPIPGAPTTKVKKVWTWGMNYVIQAIDGKTYLAGPTSNGQSNFNDRSGDFLQLTNLSGYENAVFFDGAYSNTYMITEKGPPGTTTTTNTPPTPTTTTSTTSCPGYPCDEAIKVTPLNTKLSLPYCPTTVGANYGPAMFFYFIPDHRDKYTITFKGSASQTAYVELFVARNCASPVIKSWTNVNVITDTFDKGGFYTFKVNFINANSPIINYSIYYPTTTTTSPCPGGDCFQAQKYEVGSTSRYYISPCGEPFWITFSVPFTSPDYKIYCAPNTGTTTLYFYNNYTPPTTCGTLLNPEGLPTDPTFYLDPKEAIPKIRFLAKDQKYAVYIRFSDLVHTSDFKILIQPPPTTSTTSTTTSPPAYWSVCDPCLTGGLSKCKLIPGGASVCEYASAEGPFNTLGDCINFSTPVACPNNFGCGPNCC